MRYLARQRLMQAAVLLRKTTDPVARIAHQVGYESEAAFNRAFKQEHGAPPAEWRRKEKRARPCWIRGVETTSDLMSARGLVLAADWRRPTPWERAPVTRYLVLPARTFRLLVWRQP